MILVCGHVCHGQRTLFILLFRLNLCRGKETHELVAAAEHRLETGKQLLITAHWLPNSWSQSVSGEVRFSHPSSIKQPE